MKLFIAADHAGFDLKEALKAYLQEQGHTLKDFGTHSSESMDYPDVVHPLIHQMELQQGKAMGILICGSGQGVCMTANKASHIRAALVWQEDMARLSRQHNNANVICLPARFIEEDVAKAAIEAFLTTPFEGGRHERRVTKMTAGL